MHKIRVGQNTETRLGEYYIRISLKLETTPVFSVNSADLPPRLRRDFPQI
jgi:hypothetical protein